MLQSPHPIWPEVRLLFTNPYWTSSPADTGQGWIACMSGYGVQLDDYASVKTWAVTIYNHLASGNMPLTTDATQRWPPEALAVFRTWVNEGFRQRPSDPIDRAERIPPPDLRPIPLRVRKNIIDLTQAELDDYRARIEDIGATLNSPDSPWQKIAYVHTDWCLHYQEAFLLWHRANMVYFEEMLGCAVPYWNWMSPDVAVDGSPAAGLPQAFKDETYVHPRTGETRRNPLKYAIAKDGLSKRYQGDPSPPPGSAYVQRDPVLYTTGDDQRQARQDKYDQLLQYQEQVRNAFAWPVFSQPEGDPGHPWANIQTFPAPDSSYPNKCDFDGLYEQPHDNLHGWVGPDMADNAYTAFDPVFWSHHAMIDLVYEAWLRANPAAMYTSTYPLNPFIGPRGDRIDEADPRRWVYTTIGDMARDSRALGYDFAGIDQLAASFVTAPDPSPRLFLVFDGVRCTRNSYSIDLFLGGDAPAVEDARPANPRFVLRMMRIGMGIADDKGRCVRVGVTRVVDASRTARALGLAPGTPVEVHQIVRDVHTGRVLTRAELEKLPGVVPRAVWSAGPSSH